LLKEILSEWEELHSEFLNFNMAKLTLEEWRELTPKVNYRNRFISTRTKTGTKILKKIIAYRQPKSPVKRFTRKITK